MRFGSGSINTRTKRGRAIMLIRTIHFMFYRRPKTNIKMTNVRYCTNKWTHIFEMKCYRKSLGWNQNIMKFVEFKDVTNKTLRTRVYPTNSQHAGSDAIRVRNTHAKRLDCVNIFTNSQTKHTTRICSRSVPLCLCTHPSLVGIVVGVIVCRLSDAEKSRPIIDARLHIIFANEPSTSQ